MQFKAIQQFISDNEIKFVDFRFTDSIGKEHHLSMPVSRFSQDIIDNGQSFDGSSIAGWQSIECSDMILKPDVTTIRLDPFYEHNTMFVTCDVIDPATHDEYIKCPRGVANRAEKFLKASGIGDTAFFGPEAEFFIFDSVTWDYNHSGCFVKIESEEAAWSSGKNIDGGNVGHRPGVKGGYFPVPPVDSLQDIRSDMCLILEELGIPTEIHHHEVATAGQSEIGTKYSTLVERADWQQLFKYVVKNVAHRYGKTATFMPKPIVGDNGSGMHVHQSIWKNGKNLFAGNEYAGLSKNALYYIGGIIKHAKALNAITNPSTNSYKRLVPGFEAPVILSYSARNRSAAIRIPYTSSEQGRRIEVRFPDPTANPYLAFSAMLMAGIDGIKNKITPGKAMDINLYELTHSELAKVPQVCGSLDEALDSLDKDREFLKHGGVFDDSLIDSYIKLKMEELNLYRMTTHPVEFAMYYSI
ncbi:MAG: type I glutamate--ammonia ligase [Burkholderiales bacterium]|nr:type I glutamate--ammonia ligase [Burkholderiales bacterium]